jgi:predicted GNAT family N-acyltransferase
MFKEFQSKPLFQQVVDLLQNAQLQVLRTVNSTMTYTYFEIGRMIVEEEQNGKDSAAYGKQVLKGLSEQLTKEFGKGFSLRNLEQIRQFYLVYTKSETLTRILQIQNTQSVSADLYNDKTQTVSAEFKRIDYVTLISFFKLTWSHYTFLMRIDN